MLLKFLVLGLKGSDTVVGFDEKLKGGWLLAGGLETLFAVDSIGLFGYDFNGVGIDPGLMHFLLSIESNDL